MKIFRVVIWTGGEGDGEITVEVKAPNLRKACEDVEDCLIWSCKEVGDCADEDEDYYDDYDDYDE